MVFKGFRCRSGDVEQLWSCDWASSRVGALGFSPRRACEVPKEKHLEAQEVLEQSLEAMCGDAYMNKLWPGAFEPLND